LTVRAWIADGLLALFFFVVGLELKHEFQHGSLSKPARAIVPIAAAFGGMIAPALLYVAFNVAGDGGSLRGWGVPMATDIAFALAVLSLFGRKLPLTLRAFLLTLAIVDDLGAIAIIAIFYSGGVELPALLISLAAAAAFWAAQRARVRTLAIYVPLALITWFALHESGVHATIAGVVLGFAVRADRDKGETRSPAERAERAVHPWSAGLAVPLFALTAAGINLSAINLDVALSSPIFAGIVVGLVVGKPVGIYVAARAAAYLVRSGPPEGTAWRDVALMGIVAGIGFTVSLPPSRQGSRSRFAPAATDQGLKEEQRLPRSPHDRTVRPARAKPIALDLSQDLSVEEGGGPNRAPTVLQVTNTADPLNVLSLRTCDLFAEKRAPITIT
jgi:NhaA family Na+:H+ antiporter